MRSSCFPRGTAWCSLYSIAYSPLPCVAERSLPRLPPKTLFWQDATAAALTTRRWGGLQLYLDAVLEDVLNQEGEALGQACLAERQRGQRRALALLPPRGRSPPPPPRSL